MHKKNVKLKNHCDIFARKGTYVGSLTYLSAVSRTDYRSSSEQHKCCVAGNVLSA